MPRLFSSLLLSLGIASSASAVTIDWTPIGNPGNACDLQSQGCFGAVSYAYNIGTYEVTNAQYAEFLNAKAASDPLGLYNTSMGSSAEPNWGGIVRSGAPGSYSYAPIPGREQLPVNHVSFYDTMRFANWLNNGQGNGDTETGAYTLLGGTATPSNGLTATRNAGATIFLPSEDEWYKAAYYDALSTTYYDYPTGTDAQPGCVAPTAAPNSANCDAGPFGDDATDVDIDDLTIVGAYTGSSSPYGTFDQGGNTHERNEAMIAGAFKESRGGSFAASAANMSAAIRGGSRNPTLEAFSIGIRVAGSAAVPEPSTGLLVIAGLLGLAGWRRGASSAGSITPPSRRPSPLPGIRLRY